jgi:hypothetical protein
VKVLAATLVGLALFAAPARAESTFVSMGTQSFAPSHLDVLTGDLAQQQPEDA